MNVPFFSIIVAVYNGSATLSRCLDSVDVQTEKCLEVIVADGGSTDGTLDLLNARSGSGLSWRSEPDSGISDAWNKALQRSSGEWIYFLGADDYLWSPDTLARVRLALAELPPGKTIAYGQVAMVNDSGDKIGIFGDSWDKAGPRFRGVMSIPHQGVFHRRELFDRLGEFDTSLRMSGDYELLLRELSKREPFFMRDMVVAGIQYGGISSDPENALQNLKEARSAQRKNGICLPPVAWIAARARVAVRQCLWALLGESRAREALDRLRQVAGLPRVWTKVDSD
jgi:glycosyltransferase involved in cell wall biosynthesis